LARNLASLSIDGYYHHQPIIYLVAHHFTGLTTTFLRRRSMKPVKNSIFAALLLCVLAFRTFAGDIQTPGAAAPPPPPPTNVVVTSSEGGAEPSLGSNAEQPGETVETSDYLLFEALAALLSLY
jgi:hypothetical protein